MQGRCPPGNRHCLYTGVMSTLDISSKESGVCFSGLPIRQSANSNRLRSLIARRKNQISRMQTASFDKKADIREYSTGPGLIKRPPARLRSYDDTVISWLRWLLIPNVRFQYSVGHNPARHTDTTVEYQLTQAGNLDCQNLHRKRALLRSSFDRTRSGTSRHACTHSISQDAKSKQGIPAARQWRQYNATHTSLFTMFYIE